MESVTQYWFKLIHNLVTVFYCITIKLIFSCSKSWQAMSQNYTKPAMIIRIGQVKNAAEDYTFKHLNRPAFRTWQNWECYIKFMWLFKKICISWNKWMLYLKLAMSNPGCECSLTWLSQQKKLCPAHAFSTCGQLVGMIFWTIMIFSIM